MEVVNVSANVVVKSRRLGRGELVVNAQVRVETDVVEILIDDDVSEPIPRRKAKMKSHEEFRRKAESLI